MRVEEGRKESLSSKIKCQRGKTKGRTSFNTFTEHFLAMLAILDVDSYG